jgi:RNA polymerase sigma factor (sigma-70 family)
MDAGSLRPQNFESFEAFYRREHAGVLGSLTVFAGDVDLAREATDEAFVRALERWDRVVAMDAPGGWLYRTAVNVVRRRMRRAAVERRLLFHLHPTHSEAPSSISAEVWNALRALPRRQRAAIALRYLLDLSEEQVASLMGITRGSVSATLVSARRTLADRLGESHQHSGSTDPLRTAARDQHADTV